MVTVLLLPVKQARPRVLSTDELEVLVPVEGAEDSEVEVRPMTNVRGKVVQAEGIREVGPVPVPAFVEVEVDLIMPEPTSQAALPIPEMAPL